jgi:hypothetical protein
MVKKQELEQQDTDYWKKQYDEQAKEVGALQGQVAMMAQQLQALQTLYNDKMKELNDLGFLMMQFSRDTMTKAQKEDLQRKLSEMQSPGVPAASGPK